MQTRSGGNSHRKFRIGPGSRRVGGRPGRIVRLRRAVACPVVERLSPLFRGAVGEVQRDVLRQLVAVGGRSRQVEIVRLVGIDADLDRLAGGPDEVPRTLRSTHLIRVRGHRADGERDAVVDDRGAGNGIARTRAGVVGVVVVTVAVEALAVSYLPRRRRDAEGVEGGREVDRRRDRGRRG